jgi:hypothetical protein
MPLHMKNSNIGQKIRNKKIASALLFLVFLICCYIGIFHSHRYFFISIDKVTFIIGIISLILFHSLWFDTSAKWKWTALLFIFAFGIVPLIFVIILHQSYIASVSIGHELPVKGVVTETYWVKDRRSITRYAIYTYKVNNKTLTQEMIVTDRPVEAGDTVDMVYSSIDPSICKPL